ncbi:MAG: hypothetical protein D6771_05195, partial [Zetaproteobacteria bacterium]
MGRLSLIMRGMLGAAAAAPLALVALADEAWEPERVPAEITPAYQAACGECHFAYFPALLPASDWRRLMKPDNLADHFGENAELDEAERRAIEAWLVDRAGPEIWAAKSPTNPPRITMTPWFAKAHREVENRLHQDPALKAKVRSLARCAACHPAAERG